MICSKHNIIPTPGVSYSVFWLLLYSLLGIFKVLPVEKSGGHLQKSGAFVTRFGIRPTVKTHAKLFDKI